VVNFNLSAKKPKPYACTLTLSLKLFSSPPCLPSYKEEDEEEEEEEVKPLVTLM